MFSMLSGILGFATSGLPSVLQFFQQKSDQKHELEMAQLQMQQQLAMAQQNLQAQERIEAINLQENLVQADAQEASALYAFAAKEQEGAAQWIVNLRASVRPVIAYVFVGLLVFTDVSGMIWAIWTGVDFKEALDLVFSDQEMAIVASIIGFYFGSRHWKN
jgi:hypothetical protein